MKFSSAIIASACLVATTALGQTPSAAPPPDYDGHLAAAKQAAGFDFTGTLARLCVAPWAGPGGGGGGRNPPRALWYAEPAKVFDNLVWLGTKVHSSWALTDKDGIIIIDTLYNYASGPEIIDGLKKMHLDPKDVKYVIVSHGHGDHDEGAKMLQDLGAHVVMGAPDWDAIAKTQMPGGNPKRDIVAGDGQKITVGANTVTILTTPGHTPGTLSFLFTVKDQGKPLVVAYSGGTSNIPLVNDVPGLTQYIDSQRKMAKAAAAAGASIVMSNHSEFDAAYTKVRLLAARQPGEAHPYDVGSDGVQRYFKMADECAQATRLKAQGH